MKNKMRQRCQRCNGWVEANAGNMVRKESPDGVNRWIVTHVEGECQEARVVAESPPEVPRWAVYGEGITPGGNHARGVRLVNGEAVPEVGAVPVNEPARMVLGCG